MMGSFADDGFPSERLFDLLDTVFPGGRRAAERAERLGASWQSVSTPFIRIEQGRKELSRSWLPHDPLDPHESPGRDTY